MTIAFLPLWRETGMPDPVAEYRFHPSRKSRFDYAWPDCRVALEFDGGQWVAHGGRHNRDTDREKLNHAAALGWRVLRFSNQQWERNPIDCIGLICQAITNAAKEKRNED